MTMSSSAAVPRRPAVRAEVRAGEHVVRYMHRGTGRPVLLLPPSVSADPLWMALADALCERFRVIVPELPPGDDGAAPLQAFLEGMGASGIAVVAVDGLCVPALELVLAQSEQIARTVLVTSGAAADGEGTLRHGEGAPDVSLLLLHRAAGVVAVTGRVLEFVAGEGGDTHA